MWIPSPSYAQIYTNFHSPRLLWSETHTHTRYERRTSVLSPEMITSLPRNDNYNTKHQTSIVGAHRPTSGTFCHPQVPCHQAGWQAVLGKKKKEHTHPAVEMMSKEKLSRQKHRPSSLLSHTVPKSCKVIWTRSNSDGQSHTWQRLADGNRGKNDPFILLFIFFAGQKGGEKLM